MNNLMSRIAGAPITWGVDGSPGWGYLMDAERVLTEMAEVGLRATELGPDGYLPTEPADLRAMLDRHHLDLVGGFVPAVLYRSDMAEEQLEYVERAARTLAACGSKILVLGPDSHHAGYDTPIDMTEAEWVTFLDNLDRVVEIAEANGLTAALHQHWGMAIERPHHVERLLEESTIGLCLDSGHLLVGGADPVAVAKSAGSRVVHVHLKDADAAMAERVREGDLAFRRAVIDGVFKPLGEGDIDVAGFVQAIERSGYTGWHVLEQDQVLDADPAPGEGPMRAAQTSFEYLESIVL